MTESNLREGNPGGSTLKNLIEEDYSSDTNQNIEAGIAVVKLDDLLPFIDEHHADLSVVGMKIDVESFEPLLLLGATRFLSEMRPPLIFLEIRPIGWRLRGCDVIKTLEALLSLGYTLRTHQDEVVPSGAGLKMWLEAMIKSSALDVILTRE